jgi:5-methylcytosine-specific restriction endonuclease McrA
MRASRYIHLSDTDLLRSFSELLNRTRNDTAELLACMAEVDVRRLYLPAGYPSMHAYCIEKLHMSEGATYKHIRAARTACRFPAILAAVAEGRLHLSAVVLLAAHLTPENADELLRAATHRTKAEVELLLARRFPRPDLPAAVRALPVPVPTGQLSPGTVADPADLGGSLGNSPGLQAVAVAAPSPKLAPIAPGRFVLQLTIDQDTHNMLRHAQALLGHQVPSGDLAEVLKRALGLLVARLEKRKFARTDEPRPRRRRSKGNPRYIPAHVKRAVWERDGGRCTFVGDNGHRCGARRFLEFDHVVPVARGGEATVDGLRLRCRAHNQYEAERTFGASFMNEKCAAAQCAATDRRGPGGGPAGIDPHASGGECPAPARCSSATRPATTARTTSPADADDQIGDVMAALKNLGVRGEEAHRAIERSEAVAGATIEERVRAALKCLWPRGRTRRPAVSGPVAA